MGKNEELTMSGIQSLLSREEGKRQGVKNVCVNMQSNTKHEWVDQKSIESAVETNKLKGKLYVWSSKAMIHETEGSRKKYSVIY